MQFRIQRPASWNPHLVPKESCVPEGFHRIFPARNWLRNICIHPSWFWSGQSFCCSIFDASQKFTDKNIRLIGVVGILTVYISTVFHFIRQRYFQQMLVQDDWKLFFLLLSCSFPAGLWVGLRNFFSWSFRNIFYINNTIYGGMIGHVFSVVNCSGFKYVVGDWRVP